MAMAITITDIGALGPDEVEFMRYVVETHEARQERKCAGLAETDVVFPIHNPVTEYHGGNSSAQSVGAALDPDAPATAQFVPVSSVTDQTDGDAPPVFAMTDAEVEMMVASCCSVTDAPKPPPLTALFPQFAPVPSAKLDKRGLPWDARIHAGTKSINADGTWRNLKGVDKGLLAAVEAELTALMAMPAAGVPPNADDPNMEEFTKNVFADLPAAASSLFAQTFAVEPPPAPTVPAPTVPAPTVPAPTVPAPTVPAPTVPAPTVTDFQGLTTWLTPQMLSGKVTQAQLQEIINAMGVASLMAFNARPDLIPDFVARVGAL